MAASSAAVPPCGARYTRTATPCFAGAARSARAPVAQDGALCARAAVAGAALRARPVDPDIMTAVRQTTPTTPALIDPPYCMCIPPEERYRFRRV